MYTGIYNTKIQMFYKKFKKKERKKERNKERKEKKIYIYLGLHILHATSIQTRTYINEPRSTYANKWISTCK
jgi:hypothetical protein